MLATVLELVVEALATLFFGVCCFAVGAVVIHTVGRIKPRLSGRSGSVLFYLDTLNVAITLGWYLWRRIVAY